jgi:glucokinase
MSDVVVGVDLGGTGTRVVVTDDAGDVGPHAVFATPSADRDSALRFLHEAILDVAGGRRIAGVGVGASGPVAADGMIHNRATLPAYSGFRLASALEDALDAPCVIDNDAVTAALGEFHDGASRGTSAPLMITLGTGVGASYLPGGVPFRGGDGTHPEAGHIPVPGAAVRCYCGLASCWEQVASRVALQRLVGDDLDSAAEAAHAHKGAELSAFQRYGGFVASGLGTLLSIFRPDLVVLGGGGARYFDLFGPAMQAALARAPEFGWAAPVRIAELGDLAGAIGAAGLARTTFGLPTRTSPKGS